MIFLKKVLKRISFSSFQRSRIIVFDKNYNSIIKNLIQKDFIVFNINKSKLNITLFISSALNYLILYPKNISFYEIYFKKYLRKFDPKVVITFEDTDFRILKLAQYFQKIRFIVVQNSYRSPGFYGEIKLKKTDLFITYSPLVEFNLTANEVPMKSFKYFGGKEISGILRDKVILISQFRQYNNDEMIKHIKQINAEVSIDLLYHDNPDYFIYQNLFMNFLSGFFNKNQKKIFFKSSSREQTTFIKDEEISYFKKFNIPEIEILSQDIFKSDSNEIYICFDSTMIFELISHGKKVLIYPYRKIFQDIDYNLHIADHFYQ